MLVQDEEMGIFADESASAGAESLTPSNQLEKIEDDAQPRNTLAKRFYDTRGSLKCFTTGAWSPPDPSNPDTGRCPAVVAGQASDASLLERYAHDDFNRLIDTTGFVSQTVVRSASYVYDPLDRPHIPAARPFTRQGQVSPDRRSRSLPPSRVIIGSREVHAGPRRRSQTHPFRARVVEPVRGVPRAHGAPSGPIGYADGRLVALQKPHGCTRSRAVPSPASHPARSPTPLPHGSPAPCRRSLGGHPGGGGVRALRGGLPLADADP